MKAEQISEHIWSLKAWLLIPVRVWVVTADDGVTLVDAGLPFMTAGILRFIDRLNAGPLRRILLTHGHSDHVGAIRGILDKYAVPVYAHRIEIPYMEGALPYPRRKKPERNVAAGLAAPLAESADGQLRRPMPMFTADMAEAVKSSAIVRELMPRRLEVCHGGPVFAAGEQVAAYMRKYG